MISQIEGLRREKLEAIAANRLFDEFIEERRAMVAQWIADYYVDRAAAEMLSRHYRHALKALAQGTFH
ncbi:hypothetical protein IVA95_16175 [Bradyrhizobium sp. 157]|uniref:hypothetical protein n=1 Tax=Bradyrhizobium sp. 157 TaxID=2782631 RepID=UPI001FF9EEDD|nr:hypothetical protein [Bradyrhizobium sp. 157]MCK1639098.1 hypothetical protein [Bradyrhizobium sp. 157]